MWRPSLSPSGGDIDPEQEQELRLIAHTRAGAAWALSALVARYQPLVVRYLVRLTGDEPQSHRAAESIFVRMSKRVRGPQGGEHLRLWLLRASTDAGLDILRDPKHQSAERLAAPQGPAGLIAGKVSASPVGRLLASLGARTRQTPVAHETAHAQEFVWQSAVGSDSAAYTGAGEEDLTPQERLRHRMTRTVLAELPYADAQCLSLHLIAGLNQAAVADAMGITLPAAQRHIVQGLQLFGTRYEAALASLGVPSDFDARPAPPPPPLDTGFAGDLQPDQMVNATTVPQDAVSEPVLAAPEPEAIPTPEPPRAVDALAEASATPPATPAVDSAPWAPEFVAAPMAASDTPALDQSAPPAPTPVVETDDVAARQDNEVIATASAAATAASLFAAAELASQSPQSQDTPATAEATALVQTASEGASPPATDDLAPVAEPHGDSDTLESTAATSEPYTLEPAAAEVAPELFIAEPAPGWQSSDAAIAATDDSGSAAATSPAASGTELVEEATDSTPVAATPTDAVDTAAPVATAAPADAVAESNVRPVGGETEAMDEAVDDEPGDAPPVIDSPLPGDVSASATDVAAQEIVVQGDEQPALDASPAVSPGAMVYAVTNEHDAAPSNASDPDSDTTTAFMADDATDAIDTSAPAAEHSRDYTDLHTARDRATAVTRPRLTPPPVTDSPPSASPDPLASQNDRPDAISTDAPEESSSAAQFSAPPVEPPLASESPSDVDEMSMPAGGGIDDDDEFTLVVEPEQPAEPRTRATTMSHSLRMRRRRVLSADGEAEDPAESSGTWPTS